LQASIAIEPVWSQPALCDGQGHRAARFAAVRTIAEAAMDGQLLNVLERVLEASLDIPERELPHTRRIDEDASVGKTEELPRGCAVTSTIVGVANRPNRLVDPADERVDNRRLPDAGRTEKGSRAAEPNVSGQVRHAFSRHGTG